MFGSGGTLLVSVMLGLGGPDDGASILAFGGDMARGQLVNRTVGARPWDPPDPSRPTVVVIHGFNPCPRIVHFVMGQRFADTLARHGAPVNVLAWEWNGASFVGLRASTNTRNSMAQGQFLAASLMRVGVRPERLHLVGHSAGTVVASSASRVLRAHHGVPVARLTLLEPIALNHDLIFNTLGAPRSAALVENVWAPGPSAYGQPAAHPGVVNHRVDGPTPVLGAVAPWKSNHLYVVAWYLKRVDGRTAR